MREKVRDWDKFFNIEQAVVKNSSKEIKIKKRRGLKNEKGGEKCAEEETKPNTAESRKQGGFLKGSRFAQEKKGNY